MLERLFRPREHGTTPRTELPAGLTFLPINRSSGAMPACRDRRYSPPPAWSPPRGSAIMGLYAN